MTRTLRGITWEHPRGYKPLVEAARLWKQQHPDVEVVWEQLPWYQFEEQVLGSLSRKEGRYDLVMYDHPWVGKLAQERWLLPWEELVDAAYLEQLGERVVSPSAESYVFDGQHWALPLDAASHAGLYRQDRCDSALLPKTWEAFRSWADEHYRENERYPVALCVEGVQGNCLFTSMLAGLGYPPFLSESTPRCEPTAARYVLSLLKELLAFAPPGSTRWGPWDTYAAMTARDDILCSPSIFAYVNYFTDEPRHRELRLRRVPDYDNGQRGKPILGGVGIGVVATTKHLELAAAYAQFLMSERIQQQVFPRHCGQPATWSSWSDATVNRSTHGFYPALAENMSTAYIRPRYPAYHALELRNGRVLQEFWEDRLSLTDTISRLNGSVPDERMAERYRAV